MRAPSKLINISKELNPSFFKNEDFKKGAVLTFEKDGVRTDYKIVRLNRSKQTCSVIETKLYTEDEINAMDRLEAEEIIKNG